MQYLLFLQLNVLKPALELLNQQLDKTDQTHQHPSFITLNSKVETSFITLDRGLDMAWIKKIPPQTHPPNKPKKSIYNFKKIFCNSPNHPPSPPSPSNLPTYTPNPNPCTLSCVVSDTTSLRAKFKKSGTSPSIRSSHVVQWNSVPWWSGGGEEVKEKGDVGCSSLGVVVHNEQRNGWRQNVRWKNDHDFAVVANF